MKLIITLDLANVWRSRWMSLVTSMCFASNPSLQSRAFLVLGHLVNGPADDELLYQCFVSLGKELQRHEDGLAVSIMSCISQVIRNVEPGSEYWHRSFWVAMACLQLTSVTLLSASVSLLDAVHDCAEKNGDVTPIDLSATFSAAHPLDRILKDAAESGPVGVRFEPHFSFAVTTLLLRGLKTPSSQSGTVALLRRFLRSASRALAPTGVDKVPDQALGFLVALLPSYSRRADEPGVNELLKFFEIESAGEDQERGYTPLLDFLDVPDNEPQLLIGANMLFY
jgi:hypothetical protein